MGSRCLGNDEYAGQQRRGGMGSRLHGNDGRGASSAGEGWVPDFSGTTAGGASSAGVGWVPVATGTTAGGPAVPGWDGFPLPRERRPGGQQCRGGMGSRCHGNDGRGASSAGVGWVPVATGTTAGGPAVPGWDGFPLPRERRPGGQQCRGGMGSRCHGNDGRGASSAGVGWVPVCTGTAAGGGSGIGGVVYLGLADGRAGLWVFRLCMRLDGRLAGVFLAGVVARVGGLHAGWPRAVSRPGFGAAAVFLPPSSTCLECACLKCD